MSKLASSYPIAPMSAIPTVLLEAFLASHAADGGEASIDEVERQRRHATYEGARSRARTCCGLKDHSSQAASLLVAYDELNSFLLGSVTLGGENALRDKLDFDELTSLNVVREALVALLPWHFENGAGALLPFAKWLDLVREPRS